MDIWFNRSTVPDLLPGAAVSIGNFDGVHTGHRHILQKLKAEAAARSLPAVAVVFEPQPNEFFARLRGSTPPARLSPLRDKLGLLRDSGCVDAVRVLHFGTPFAAQPAQRFIDTVLLAELNTRYLLVGDDFRFGCGREGGFDLLQAQTAFVTEQTPSILVAGERASSTAVRSALQAGRLDRAAQILGHDYVLSGRVKHGKKLGRQMGCPTANVHLPPHHYALSGVFVVEAAGRFGRRRGVASFGRNPTVETDGGQKLEVHIFDFSGNLYGERLTVHFLHKLHDEEKFADLDSLRRRIHADMVLARNWR
ncbi:bifunctional riboflavin kinase/FAD synthetase [Neisseria leonii]|uniref:bifunctional riboflavin kinase/FAD synthetase n=1 Tax=Neisseria leonii TaxID=2995413 RepID=UPI00237A3ED1|nr:bifunctional riboflavin kinase/FAD synthetase [Neisseria sp. 3986]MDD9326153.1 bifunctional riboflavin kinase/FAD synthetase [Neisseria sp. 3986]